jgi:hypothetical protein
MVIGHLDTTEPEVRSLGTRHTSGGSVQTINNTPEFGKLAVYVHEREFLYESNSGGGGKN